jgi:hypothetical protein
VINSSSMILGFISATYGPISDRTPRVGEEVVTAAPIASGSLPAGLA